MEASLAPALDQRPFEHLVLDYLAELEFERGLSRNTLEAYRSDLLQLGNWLEPAQAEATTAAASDLAVLLSEACDARGARRPRGLPQRARLRRRVAGDAAAQGGVPALVLSPPAPRGHHPPRP